MVKLYSDYFEGGENSEYAEDKKKKALKTLKRQSHLNDLKYLFDDGDDAIIDICNFLRSNYNKAIGFDWQYRMISFDFSDIKNFKEIVRFIKEQLNSIKSNKFRINILNLPTDLEYYLHVSDNMEKYNLIRRKNEKEEILFSSKKFRRLFRFSQIHSKIEFLDNII